MKNKKTSTSKKIVKDLNILMNMKPEKKTEIATDNELRKNNDLLVIVRSDDWEGLFVRGKKVYSHHKVPVELVSEWSAKLQMVVIGKWVSKEEELRAEELGDFPDNLSEIELE